jgi:hypothetical protein
MRIQLTKITLAAILALAIAFNLTSCDGGKSALVGRWEASEGYSSIDLELLSDGTGIGDNKAGITWKVEKDRFYMTKSFSGEALSFSYKISGSVLTLTDDNGDVLKFSKKEKCGDKWYNLATQSCKGNEIVNDTER